MLDRLKRMFSKRSPVLSGPETASPYLGVTWIDGGQNPYGVRVLDCRSICRAMRSATGDPRIAERFLQLRSSRGEEYRGQLPPNCLHEVCDLPYRRDEDVPDGPLFKAEAMEDKWDIYLYSQFIYFVRSWRGDLVFRAALKTPHGEAVLSSLDADSAFVKGDGSLALRMVDFLVKSHILKREVPHPLPADLPADPRTIFDFSFACYGRWASFATYADTLRLRG